MHLGRNEWKPSGRTIHIHVETVDTGKRRKMFGYMARKASRWEGLPLWTTINPPGDSSQMSMETDGWYIDPPSWLWSPHAGVQYVGYGGAKACSSSWRGPSATVVLAYHTEKSAFSCGGPQSCNERDLGITTHQVVRMLLALDSCNKI